MLQKYNVLLNPAGTQENQVGDRQECSSKTSLELRKLKQGLVLTTSRKFWPRSTITSKLFLMPFQGVDRKPLIFPTKN